MKRKLPGFTLIELLIVIAIIALLAAILFPVFFSIRAKGQQTACLSNLRQLSLGVFQYAQDNDDHYPYGGDPSDINTNGWKFVQKGKYWPAVQQMQANHQTIPTVMSAYVKNSEIWHCPSDTGFDMGGVMEDIPLKAYPSSFQAFGTSYAYTTQLALDNQTITSVKVWSTIPPFSEHSPADVPLLYDLVGHWHGGKAWSEERFNFVMLDGHAVNVSRYRANELNNIIFTIPALTSIK